MSKSPDSHSPSRPSNSSSTKDCQVCKKFNSRSSVINICFEVDQALFEKVVGSNKRRKLDKKEPLENFLKAINALLNEGGGFVYVHTEKPSLLALFDEQVDSKMNSLIADDSLFHHNFHRFYYDDNHVCFSVKQYPRDHISTLCFSTKVSLNSGLTDPNPAQMRRLMQSDQSGSQTSSETEISDHMKTSLVKISKDSLVYTETSRGTFVFSENVCTQAKQIPEGIINIRSRKEFIEKLKDYIWEKSSNYITAFSKVQSGGSIYFGLSEIEENLKNQETKAQSDNTQKRRSGTFKYTGVVLRKQEQEEIKKMVELKVREEMLFFGKGGWYNPVSVVYHSVKGGEADLNVIEVKVRQFHGVVFNSRSGPQSYEWNRRTEKCDVMSPTNWIKYHNSEFSPFIP